MSYLPPLSSLVGSRSIQQLGKFMRYLHRLVFYPLSLVAFFWGFLALRVNPFELLYDFEFLALLKALYIADFTASFWPLVYIELVDYL